jgi:iron complex outermembrane receptor protein
MVGADGLDSVHNSDIDNPNNPAFFVVNFNDAERRVLGIFAERQQDFGNAWSAEFGLRYNRVEMDADVVDGTPAVMPAGMILRDQFNSANRRQTDDNLDAVAKVLYHATDKLSYYLGLARKNRSPAYQERYLWLPLQATGGLADGFTYTGNIELKPEVAHEIELGLDFNGGGLVMSPRLFYRDVEDYIQGTASAVPAASMFVNMMNINNGTNNSAPLQFNNVDATLWGFDMDWRYDINEVWSLSGLVNYVRGERDDIDDNLYRIAPFNGSVELAYRSNNWGAAVETVLYDEQNKVSATNNEQESDRYGLLNMSAYWQASSGLRLVLGLDNALDEDYAEHTGGTNRIMGNPDLAAGVKLPGYGRNVYARLDLTF